MFADQVPEELDRDGAVVSRGVLTGDEIARLRELFGALHAGAAPRSRQILYTHEAPPPGRPGLSALMDQWLYPASHLPGAPELLARLSARFSALAGYELIPFQDVAMSKTAQHAALPWHEDLPFWPVDRDDGIVSWIALDPVGDDNGGLEVAFGSHRGPRGSAIDLHTGEPQRGGGAQVPAEGDVPSLAAGDAIVFDARCWHRSGRNASGAPRRVWSISWVHVEARFCFERAPRHPLRGRERDGERVSSWSMKSYPLRRG